MRHTPAIILAAGKSRRMGRPKALLPFRQGTFLSTLAETLGGFCSPLIAVFGFEADSLMAAAPRDVISVVNPDYEAGMLRSLQAGLRAVDLSAAERILFTLVDHPAISPETIATLLKSDAPIAIPRFNGRRGHPVVVARDLAHEFLAEPPTSKVRYVIDQHASVIDYVEVQDAAINDDIDEHSQYVELLQREAVHS